MLKKVCLRIKEPFNLLTYWSWDPYRPEDFLLFAGFPTQTEKSPLKSPDFSITIHRTVFAENPLKFPYDTYFSQKKTIKISPKL
jgi:hypothetical protein